MKYTDKLYGKCELSGVIEELISTGVFQRLRKIHQGGALFLVNNKINHTRFEHSVGVMLLIKRLGGNIEEQIAGLLHDISHTAFSHLIDYVLEIEEEDFHERRYEEVLQNRELFLILEKYGFTMNQFSKIEQYHILEYPLPYLSADRIDYTLRDLFQIGKISTNEIDWFLDGLITHENRVVLKSEEYGKWFQSKYNYLNTAYFGGEESKLINTVMKQIIKNCLREGTIEISDFYEDDFYLIEKIEKIMNLKKHIGELTLKGLGNNDIKTKSRIVNPEVLVNNKVTRLSEIK
ncbi:HD domain-containing protein [Cytophagaceae bacterium ABcell3]|nr:HD domain-containing protein [Cytophagaceae bacterium ABcell3]